MDMLYGRALSRCWAEIDLSALVDNYFSAREMLARDAELIPVLKANAYGTGAARVSRALYEAGARLFAVATVSEALEIKRNTDADVLVMGMAGDDAPRAIRAGVILTVFSLNEARALGDAATRAHARCRVHIKVDTGLHRLGFTPRLEDADMICAAKMPGLSVEGLYTHLALHDKEGDMLQLALLERARQTLCDAGVNPGLIHALDSIGLTRYPEYSLGGARVGAWLYGVKPSGCAAQDKPVVTLRARVAQVRAVAKGELIGYDDDHPLARDARVATVACGYADGYIRKADACEALVRGARARVLGLTCMDQMMIDVTDIPDAKAGDVVTLLGAGISLDEYARWGGLNRNEALSRLTRRVPRVYFENGHVVEIADDMDDEERLL